mmetsp:Transcript_74743/g.219046  ORF Transcript_74743/g.219046 Transcript_74743/m.219046 type:complete len:303 (-) Transcript_74743:88-996(-)
MRPRPTLSALLSWKPKRNPPSLNWRKGEPAELGAGAGAGAGAGVGFACVALHQGAGGSGVRSGAHSGAASPRRQLGSSAGASLSGISLAGPMASASAMAFGGEAPRGGELASAKLMAVPGLLHGGVAGAAAGVKAACSTPSATGGASAAGKAGTGKRKPGSDALPMRQPTSGLPGGVQGQERVLGVLAPGGELSSALAVPRGGVPSPTLPRGVLHWLVLAEPTCASTGTLSTGGAAGRRAAGGGGEWGSVLLRRRKRTLLPFVSPPSTAAVSKWIKVFFTGHAAVLVAQPRDSSVATTVHIA